MALIEHYRKLERMYLAAPVNAFYQPRIQIDQGAADIIIPIQPQHFHAAGAAHGCVYFKAMDDAAFFSANSLVEEVFVLTSSFTVYLTRPISTGEMRAHGRVVNATRSQFIAESVVQDSEGREIARGSGCFVRSKIPLTPDIGYR